MCPYKGIEFDFYGVGVPVHITADKIKHTFHEVPFKLNLILKFKKLKISLILPSSLISRITIIVK